MRRGAIVSEQADAYELEGTSDGMSMRGMMMGIALEVAGCVLWFLFLAMASGA